MECTVDTLEAESQFLTCELLRNHESADVAAGLIVVERHIRRVNKERVGDVGIMGLPPALQLPNARHLDPWPSGGVVGGCFKTFRGVKWAV